MPLYIINDKDYVSIITANICIDAAIFAVGQEPCHPVRGKTEPVISSGDFQRVMKHRDTYGHLDVGQTFMLDMRRETGLHFVICTAVPFASEQPSYETLKLCYLNALRAAGNDRMQMDTLVLLPFYERYEGRKLKVPTYLYYAELEAANEFLAEYGDKYRLLIMTNTYAMQKLHANDNEQIDLSMPSFKRLHPDDWEKTAADINRNAETVEHFFIRNRRLHRRAHTHYEFPLCDPDAKKRSAAKNALMRATQTAEYDIEKIRSYIGIGEEMFGSGSKLADAAGINKSTVSRMFERNKNHDPETVIALAVAMKLSREERIDFIRSSGYPYPYTPRDNFIETLLGEQEYSVVTLNIELSQQDPKWALSANKHAMSARGGSAKRKKAARKPVKGRK